MLKKIQNRIYEWSSFIKAKLEPYKDNVFVGIIIVAFIYVSVHGLIYLYESNRNVFYWVLNLLSTIIFIVWWSRRSSN